MAIPNTVMIAMAYAKHEVDNCSGDLREKLKVAMQSARNSWCCTNEDEQFRAAVGAVMQHYGQNSQEWDRIESEMRNIQAVSLMIQAATAGLMVTPPAIDENFEPIGLLSMWREIQQM